MASANSAADQRGFTPLSIVLIAVLPLFAGFAAWRIFTDLLVAFLLFGTFLFWLIHEHFLVPAGGARNPSPSDRGTIRFLSITKLIAWMTGPTASLLVTPLKIWGANWAIPAIGIAMMWVGIGLRRWAIWKLGVFFRRDIAVQQDHKVIDDGPYGVVRHPSYSGDLMTFLGFGCALANWASVALCFLLPLIGYRRRLLMEEDVLGGALGEEYAAYQERTRWRLVPGVW